MYDLIGDIHGYADELVQLLEVLGYRRGQGIYRHPERKVIFLGDFIDRGPKIRQVLQIVRPMIDGGHALAVMGNHELNALAYHTADPESPGEFLRRRCAKNVKQHGQTVEQLGPQELGSYLDWFRTLPLWLELDGLRAVHACWDERAIAMIAHALREHGGVTAAFVQSACRKGQPLFAAVEVFLKGKEAALPQGVSFRDNDGHVRTAIRTRWYLPPAGQTYRTYALQTDEVACDVGLEEAAIAAAEPYPAPAKPVFVGHYWLSANQPEVLAENVACLDYSVAKGGFLCAYRWNGEQRLSNENFVWVEGGKRTR
jgi:Calcineurin-like phosphoesterase